MITLEKKTTQMTKQFFIQIDKAISVDSIFLRQCELEGLIEKYLKSEDFNLYYITYVDRIRFDLNKCSVKNEELEVFLTKGVSEIKIKVSDLRIKNINFDKSSNKIIYAETYKGLIRLTINELRTRLDLDLNMKQEIVYIGQSKNISNRIKNHEKLIRAFASIGDNQDLLINFIKPSFGYTDLKTQAIIHFNKGTLLKTNFVDMDYEKLINLTERILINFYQPILNSDFINIDFAKDNTIQRIKSKTNFDKLLFLTKLEGHSYQFFTQNQKIKTDNFLINDNYNYEKLK